MVNNSPAMQETWVQSLGWEDPLEKGTATHSQYACLNSMDRGAWKATVHGGHKELYMTERLSHIYISSNQRQFWWERMKAMDTLISRLSLHPITF